MAAPRGCTSFRLRSLARLVGRRYDARMAAVDLKTTQYSLLSALWRKGPMRAADLAAVLALEASTLTRNVDPLIRAGWVEATVGADRRTRVLALTAAGLAHRRAAKAEWLAAQTDIEALLGPALVGELHRLLDHCRDVLEAADPAPVDGHESRPEAPARRSSTRTRT